VVLRLGRAWSFVLAAEAVWRGQNMGDIVGAVLAGTVLLVLMALAIYVVVSNSTLLTIVGVCAATGGALGYLRALALGRTYNRGG